MPAQLIVHNADILTQNVYQPVVQAFAVNDGKFIATGRDEEVLQLRQPDTILVDAAGKTILPGFIDAHIHIWKVGNLKTFLLDLRGISSIEEMQDKLSDFIRQNPGGGWIQARGFNEAGMKEKRLPDRADLDKITATRPLWVIRTCAHIGIANTKAMQLAGISAGMHIPAGGEMRIDAGGAPNGIFTETALGLVANAIPPYSPADYERMIISAEEEMLRYGITSATDPAVMPGLLSCYLAMEQQNKLRVRVNAFPVRVPDGSEEILPLPSLYHSGRLSVNTVKFFADGGLSGMTAAMNKPYKNSLSHGILRLREDFFYSAAKEAADKGFCIATHAIGDKAIDVVLNVYKALFEGGKTGMRIEHLGLPNAEHLQSMQAMNVHCVSQSIFLKELGKNFEMYLEQERLSRCYPYRSILDAGVNLALSSDAPVVKDFNPFTGIKSAIFRRTSEGGIIGPTEKISLHEAIHAYTMGAAKANGNPGETGSIEAGKHADFIILNKTLGHSIQEDEQLSVLATWINGEKLFGL
ncbi:MAG TPA: amidohydrolase [Chitinophagaceae bacterium]|nr:amidohydrolase [Chitinophagaceae bacterium]